MTEDRPVACELEDAPGLPMDVRRETAIVSLDHLDAASTHPRGDVLAGEMVQPHVDAAGREGIRVEHLTVAHRVGGRHDPVRVPAEALEQQGEPEK